MATTTNYGWTTPDDTALVKDGASAIRTLGTSVDTTTKALNPSTTLGDIEYRSSTANTNTRLAIGTTGQILTVAGGVPSWATATAAAKSYTLINTGGTSLSGSSTQISSLSGYNYLFVHIDSATVSSSANVRFRMNADTGSNYYAASGDGDTNAMTFVSTAGGSAGTATEHFIIIDAANSTGVKPFSYSALPAGGATSSGAGYYGGTSIISSFTAIASAGSFNGGTIKIYGAN
jgi:hypothetical protein